MVGVGRAGRRSWDNVLGVQERGEPHVREDIRSWGSPASLGSEGPQSALGEMESGGLA